MCPSEFVVNMPDVHISVSRVVRALETKAPGLGPGQTESHDIGVFTPKKLFPMLMVCLAAGALRLKSNKQT